MEMSVSVAPGKQAAPNEAKPGRIRTSPNSSDLDEWLAKVEAMGELKRITAEVDPDLEAATITYLVGSEKSPALLFENIKGHPGHRALYNMIGCNLSRFCLMIGEEPVDHPLKAVQALQRKMGRKMAPQGGAGGNRDLQPEHRRPATTIDIRKFPAQRMWPLDGGLYLGTGDAVVTQCPETGRINVGTYRMMIKGPREIGVYTSPGKDATLDREKWWKMGKPMPIAACLRHRSAAVSGRGDELSEDRERIRVLRRHQRRADRAVQERRHRPAAAGARRDHPRRLRLSGRDLRRRAVRRIHRLLRPAERRDAVYAGRESPLPQQSDADLRADGGRSRQRMPDCSGRRCARRRSGPICKSSACPASRACGRSRKPPAGASPSSRSSRCIPATRRR